MKEAIHRGPLKLQELIDVAAQVLNGLEAAHAEGVIHRDVKPANIFVTKKGAVKILTPASGDVPLGPVALKL